MEEDGRGGVKRGAEESCPGGSVRADKGGEDAKERGSHGPPVHVVGAGYVPNTLQRGG